MFYQYVSEQYHKLAGTPAPPPANKAKSTTAPLNKELLAYLQQQNILDSKMTSIPFTEHGILRKLFNLSSSVYKHFTQNYEVLAAWCNVLNMTVAYLYINDFLGGITSQQDFQTKWQTFFQAVQKESSSLQNPASEYVG